MAKYAVIGRGFLGKAVAEKLGDVSWYPTKDTRKLFYMDGPTHPDFDANSDYWQIKNSQDFTFHRDYCKERGIKFIYASSALVYEPQKMFGAYKKALEEIAGEGTLGLRIFPVTGPGGHTVIEEWREQMQKGESPVVWGDGTQTRDFIPLWLAVDKIVYGSDKVGTIDIGVGQPKSFNQIIDELNKELGTDIKPTYVPAPEGYVKEGVVYGQK